MPTLVPRDRRCGICKSVAKIEDVTVRLFDPEHNPLPPKEAVDYLRSIGRSGSYEALSKQVKTHQKHVAKALAGDGEVAPVSRMEPMVPVGGAPTWLSLNEAAVDTGMDALSMLRARLDAMDDRDLIAVAKLGQTASSKRGDWEAKGRQLNQMDSLIKLAAGLSE